MNWMVRLLILSLLVPACSERREGMSGGQTEQGLNTEKRYLRLSTDAPGKLRHLLAQRGLDVAGSSHRLGFVDVIVDASEQELLLPRHGSRIKAIAPLDIDRGSRVIAGYHTPADLDAFASQIEAAYPQIAKKVILRTGLPEGGTIFAMKISDNVGQDEDEPTFMMDAGCHAREVMPPEVAMDAIEFLTSNYGSDPQVTAWVDGLEIWIVPLVNPDGVAYAHDADNWWRKNRSHTCGSDIGVDINRNYEWNYRQCEGSSDSCWDETYHGSGAASEPETQTLQALQEELRPLYFLTYHSFGEYIIWPSACERLDEDALLAHTGQALNALLENDDGQTGQWAIGIAGDVLYNAPGGAEDHAYGAAGAVGLTIELNSSSFQPSYDNWRDITVLRQRAGWGYMLEQTLNGPAVRGHTFDGLSSAPVQATFTFANHPFQNGQWPLQADQAGRFGRAVLPDTEHVLVFTAPGYLPETRVVDVQDGPVDLEVPMFAGTNQAPAVDAGPDQEVNEGDTVTLDATGSSDPDGNDLFFLWQQTAGPTVFLEQGWSAQPHFFAPSVDGDTLVTFQVIASDGELQAGPASVDVTIHDVWNQTSVFDSTDTPISIPDNNPQGIVSIIHVSEDQPVLKAVVHLDISHTWIGDLHISLSSPAGTEVVLHNHEGGNQQDLHADYTPAEFIGERSAGDWVLRIVDAGPSDVGTLDAWTLSLDLAGSAVCANDGDCTLPQASQSACLDGACVILACETNWEDCNGQASDGCEADTEASLTHCGACFQPCAFANAAALCQAGACTMGACAEGFENCNGLSPDGCERDLSSDPQSCGGCDQPCDLPNAVPSCSQGECQVASCLGLWANCDGQAANGCERDVSADMQHCGACGRPCAPAHGEGSCQDGQCILVACLDSFEDCDGSAANGCERDLNSDPQTCGSCLEDCTEYNAQALCQDGVCAIGDCQTGFADCNANAADGCEAELAIDPQNCGSCGEACDLAQATPDCQNGSCRVESCLPGYGNCNNLAEDGCEADLAIDPQHCGTCQIACALDNASVACQAGTCAIDSCDPAFGDCNQDPADGCEVYLNNNADHCGGCDESCAAAHAESICRQGSCRIESCGEGWGDCNDEPQDGCETSLAADAANCGSCERACDYANADNICQTGDCYLQACHPGFGNCNDQVADGCEADLSSDTQHCGRCGIACDATSFCVQGNCGPPCADGDGDGYRDAACGGPDCDDGRAEVNPDMAETCNGRDDNCDGQVDEGLDCPASGCDCGTAGSPGGGFALGLLMLLALLRRRSPENQR